MRLFGLFLLLGTFLSAQTLKIDRFESDLFSQKSKTLQKIRLTLVLEGRDLNEERYKILDALNVVISSFYVETLFTSKGKERFKEVLIRYLQKKYGVDADALYFEEIVRETQSDIEAFVDLLEKRGCCTPTPRKSSISPIAPQKPQILYPQE